MASSPGRAWRTRRSSGGSSITLVEVLMLVAMGRHATSEPRGRGKNSGRFHPFRSSFFQVCQLRICMMYVLAVVRYVLTSAREKSGAVVGKNEGQGAKLEGFS